MLHFALMKMIDIQPGLLPRPNTTAFELAPTVVALFVFGILIAADQLYSLRLDGVRHRMLNRAFALVRTVHGEDGAEDPHRLALIAEHVPALLDAQSLELHFQPIPSIVENIHTVRFEALLRLHLPALGYISPEAFFVACDRLQLTARADRIIIAQALECSRAWRGAGTCNGISVNVGPATLLDSSFVAWLETIYEPAMWPAGWLQLELTEHAMISHPCDIAVTIRQLAELGIQVVMDDFGAGFSSLGVLVDLPISGIKCDRTFVNTLQHDVARQTLLTHICRMAQDLGLSVTVEGVETLSDLRIVRACGATHVQGYVFAKAMPVREVSLWLHRSFLDATVPGFRLLPAAI
jgi:EAL domain-containing protein (putative c-di-GMP-specific phosphodiesterase class I)